MCSNLVLDIFFDDLICMFYPFIDFHSNSIHEYVARLSFYTRKICCLHLLIECSKSVRHNIFTLIQTICFPVVIYIKKICQSTVLFCIFTFSLSQKMTKLVPIIYCCISTAFLTFNLYPHVA